MSLKDYMEFIIYHLPSVCFVGRAFASKLHGLLLDEVNAPVFTLSLMGVVVVRQQLLYGFVAVCLRIIEAQHSFLGVWMMLKARCIKKNNSLNSKE